MITKLNKEDFIKLAEAYTNQEDYENELKNSLNSITRNNGLYMDSIGLPISSEIIMDVVSDLLGDDFCYYFYDCKKDFNKFNKGTTLKDGSHPNVKDFGELWEFIHKFETEE